MDELSHSKYKVEKYTKDEECLLIRRAQGGDIAARNRLIENYMPFCHHLANRYPDCKGYTRDDLAQEGAFALMKALERYKFNKGARFGTFAAFLICDFQRAYSFRNKSNITRPRSIRYSNEEHKVAERNMVITSLQDLSHHDDEHDFDVRDDRALFYNVDDADEMKFWIDKARKYLNARSFKIFEGRMQGKTQAAIGKEMSYSESRISQIYKESLKILKRVMAND